MKRSLPRDFDPSSNEVLDCDCPHYVFGYHRRYGLYVCIDEININICCGEIARADIRPAALVIMHFSRPKSYATLPSATIFRLLRRTKQHIYLGSSHRTQLRAKLKLCPTILILACYHYQHKEPLAHPGGPSRMKMVSMAGAILFNFKHRSE